MKDSRLGKGYSIFFALVICGLMIAQSVRVEVNYVNQAFELKFLFVEIPLLLALIEILLIAYLLGVPTDRLASRIAEILGYKNQDPDQ